MNNISTRDFLQVGMRQQGFTMAELLIATLVGAIVITAAIAAYSVISNQYRKQIDLGELYGTSTQLRSLFSRELRMAGARDINTKNGALEGDDSPLVIGNNEGAQNSDVITVVYDQSDSKRIKHVYKVCPAVVNWSTAGCNKACASSIPAACVEEGRYRLYRQSSTRTDGGGWITDGDPESSYQPVADYVEDLQICLTFPRTLDSEMECVSDTGASAFGIEKSSLATISLILRSKRKYPANDEFIKESFSVTTQLRNLGGRL
jgi:prepilin-type N-terminal cleavage/methylation domain-containing protein